MFERCVCSKKREVYDFTCSDLSQIPPVVGRHKNTLVELVLDSNHITRLTKPLFLCSNLQRLYLSNNNLSSVPHEIGYLDRLVELNLSHNEIDEISDEIRRCQCLEFLEISNNNIRKIPQGILELDSLKVLNANECSLVEIPKEINMLKNLRTFESRDNLIDEIPDSIGDLTSLNRLDLACNEISRITSAICKLTNLTELWLDTNILSSIPNEIGNLKNLKMLELSNNPLKTLPDSLCELKNLQELALTSNQLCYLPTCIGKLTKLKNLKLDFNRIAELPKSIGHLKSLVELSLLGNQLTSLPNTIGNLQNLICIYADGNKLSHLPDEICECSSLNILSLRDNFLSTLPVDFGNLSNLAVIEMRGNIIKFFPKSMSNLNMLRCLWLTSSQQRPLYELQVEHHPTHGEVLTCFLLPQKEKETHDGGPSATANDINYNQSGSYFDQNLSIMYKSRLSSVEENPEYLREDLAKDLVELDFQLTRNQRTSDVLSSSSITEVPFKGDELENISGISTTRKEESQSDNFMDVRISDSKDLNEYDKNYVQQFFETEKIELCFPSGERDFDICGGIDQIHHIFGNSESPVFVSSIEDTKIMRNSHLRVGDRIISINGITMSLISNAEAKKLLDLHENSLKLLIRHDPPVEAFVIVDFVREDTTQKFGITLTGISKAPTQCSPLIVGQVSENGIAYATGKVKKGMWLIEVNNEFLICYTREKATQLLANITGLVKLILFDPEYASKVSETEDIEDFPKEDINGHGKD